MLVKPSKVLLIELSGFDRGVGMHLTPIKASI
jgi:hypothetical protein